MSFSLLSVFFLSCPVPSVHYVTVLSRLSIVFLSCTVLYCTLLFCTIWPFLSCPDSCPVLIVHFCPMLFCPVRPFFHCPFLSCPFMSCVCCCMFSAVFRAGCRCWLVVPHHGISSTVLHCTVRAAAILILGLAGSKEAKYTCMNIFVWSLQVISNGV